jgi:hypothetical protein
MDIDARYSGYYKTDNIQHETKIKTQNQLNKSQALYGVVGKHFLIVSFTNFK